MWIKTECRLTVADWDPNGPTGPNPNGPENPDEAGGSGGSESIGGGTAGGSGGPGSGYIPQCNYIDGECHITGWLKPIEVPEELVPEPLPEEDPLKWNNANSLPIEITDCVDLSMIAQKNWFDLTNGSRIAHLIDAMRYEYKNLENGGYIDLGGIFNFGRIGGSDNYTPSFVGRVIINGKVLDITIELALIGNNTAGVDGSSIPLPDPFNANIKGYHKTGYWAGYKYYTNDNNGGSSVMIIQIKLGETRNTRGNADIFLNAIKECVD